MLALKLKVVAKAFGEGRWVDVAARNRAATISYARSPKSPSKFEVQLWRSTRVPRPGC